MLAQPFIPRNKSVLIMLYNTFFHNAGSQLLVFVEIFLNLYSEKKKVCVSLVIFFFFFFFGSSHVGIREKQVSKMECGVLSAFYYLQ